jgi:hypothetical protein
MSRMGKNGFPRRSLHFVIVNEKNRQGHHFFDLGRKKSKSIFVFVKPDVFCEEMVAIP